MSDLLLGPYPDRITETSLVSQIHVSRKCHVQNCHRADHHSILLIIIFKHYENVHFNFAHVIEQPIRRFGHPTNNKVLEITCKDGD